MREGRGGREGRGEKRRGEDVAHTCMLSYSSDTVSKI